VQCRSRLRPRCFLRACLIVGRGLLPKAVTLWRGCTRSAGHTNLRSTSVSMIGGINHPSITVGFVTSRDPA